MAIMGEVVKKIAVAAISGGLILGFVYVKDKYLSSDEANTDMEVLNSTAIVEEPEPVVKKEEIKPEPVPEVVKKVVDEVEETVMTIEVQTPEVTQEESTKEEIVEKEEKEAKLIVKEDKSKVLEPKKVKETLDDEFANFKANMGSHDAAFDDLDKEMMDFK